MSETTAAHRQVGFGEAISLYLKNYFRFEGRSSRGAYWWAVLALFLIGLLFGVVDAIVFPNEAASPLGSIVGLATFFPSLTLGIRRLHDLGKSGWWTLLVFLPIIGLLVLLYWAAQPGQRADNAYGPDAETGR